MFLYLAMIEDEAEQNKFTLLYQAYHNLMFYIAYQILENQQDAEDAVHEACVRIVDVLDKISEPVCPKTRALVGIITRGKAVDLYRKRKRHAAVPWEDWNNQALERAVSEGVEEADSTLQAMASLPPRQRDLLMLRYDQGFEVREIAGMMNMTPANVDKTLQRAKKQLRKNLEEQGVKL